MRAEKFSIYLKHQFTIVARGDNLVRQQWRADSDFGRKHELLVRVSGSLAAGGDYTQHVAHLDNVIRKCVVQRLHKKDIKHELMAFNNNEPTIKNLATIVYCILREEIDLQFAISVLLHDDNNYFEI